MNRKLLILMFVCSAMTNAAFAKTSQWDEYINTGMTAYKEESYSKAEQSFSTALKLAEKFGPQDKRLTKSLDKLASFYREQGIPAKAEPLYKRLLMMKVKALGPSHPDVASAVNNLAEAFEFEGKRTEAEALYKRSLRIQEKTYGSNHPNVLKGLE